MGWSYRKSFGAGPFRVNLSKGGISYSFGVKGARVNVGPKGTYVNLSSQGITYRKKLSGGHSQTPVIPEFIPVQHKEEVHNIASAGIEQLTDSASKDFIAELSDKAGQVSYMKWFGVVPLILFLLYLMFSSFNAAPAKYPPTDSVVARVTSPVGVYVRKSSNGKSEVLKAATHGQTFLLLDSANRKWLKVSFNDTIGYISRRFATIDRLYHDKPAQTSLSNPYAGYQLAGGLVFFTVLIVRLRKLDKKRFEMELHYDMDEQLQQVYKQFSDHFATFSRSHRIWQYVQTQQTNDYKRNAGAGKLINRVAVRELAGNKLPLPYFITNVSIPYLKLRNLELYFLPERLLVRRGNTFAAVFYKNLSITGHTTRFIEEESLPGDASVVDRTWRYVNKRGGPDRRFNNNRQLPICAYSEYALTSDTGIYEVITTSKQGAMDPFATFLTRIGELQERMSIG